MCPLLRMARKHALRKRTDAASIRRAKARCGGEKKGPKRRACVAAQLHVEPEAYLRAQRACARKEGRNKSKCIAARYLEQCRKVDESVCLDPARPSRLQMYRKQKWVYLRPLLQSNTRVFCGTRASRKGHACRPTVRVEGARTKTVKDMLEDPGWLPEWSGSNDRKLNRLAAYKDARGSGITMYWSRGRFRDSSTRTLHDFRALNLSLIHISEPTRPY